MTHKELVDRVSSDLIKKGGKIETRRSWRVMRNYLEQLDCDQLRSILKQGALK